MKIFQQLSLFVGGCALCLSTAMATAAVNDPPVVSPGDATVALGAQAMPTVTFAFSSPYEFTSLTLYVDYESTLMTFNAAQSTLSVNGTEKPVADFLATLKSTTDSNLSYLPPTDDPGSYSLSAFFPSGYAPIPVGPMVLKGVFDLKPSFLAGMHTDVYVYGTITSTAADFDSSLIDNFSVVPRVTAVPEPETWLMLLCGLSLVTAVGRRRKLLQVSGSDSTLVAAQ